ncbi:hypothetical protein OS42_27130 [Dickeya oryzae]
MMKTNAGAARPKCAKLSNQAVSVIFRKGATMSRKTVQTAIIELPSSAASAHAAFQRVMSFAIP